LGYSSWEQEEARFWPWGMVIYNEYSQGQRRKLVDQGKGDEGVRSIGDLEKNKMRRIE
jgi:hypothetical protein